jgi:Fe-S oxidoreductase
VYDAPRQLLASAGATSVEPEWNHSNALCCGGGSGFAFMEEKSGTRMNQNRAKQLLATGADTVGVACPFCMIMVEDGMKSVADENWCRFST